MITRIDTSEDRLICRHCKEIIMPGEQFMVFIHDDNPVGTGPVEHTMCVIERVL